MLALLFGVLSSAEELANLEIGPGVLKAIRSTGKAEVLFQFSALPGLATREIALTDDAADVLVEDLKNHAQQHQAQLLEHLTMHHDCTVHRRYKYTRCT
jgi:hypothetical protein